MVQEPRKGVLSRCPLNEPVFQKPPTDGRTYSSDKSKIVFENFIDA